ncbi:MAG: hypothetical protein DI624_07885 [Brevundimonas sp.]|jgi:uncharacterized membrane protein HdeD (DUF308 family)|uniref:HdeD family acid-resistance protein n=1 Tax=Brevundimonas sp. TaxID=1871086 RepID=UPI000DB78B6F|nr:HdeD family acid-resistance protein [Brevundimonas sp.]PZT98327.1 MAG: hypothetical protein DI624_07885 [Brevundimonas sp.]
MSSSPLDILAHRFLNAAWWAVLIRGVAAVIFGVLVFAWPGISLLSLIIVYGAYAVVDGVFALVSAFQSKGSGVWSLVLVGIVSVAAGLIALVWPGVTALILVLIIGWAAVFRGVFEIVAAIRLRKRLPNEWLLILAGVISILFGAVLIAAPGPGALALLWLIATWAVIFGVALIVLAFRLKKAAGR